MKSVAFLSKAQELIPVEFGRLQKIAGGLRKAGLFPDGRAVGETAHVTAVQAAQLIRAMALNLNPFTENFAALIDEYRHLVSKDSFFIQDLAEILIHGGAILPGKKGINGVHHISFSLDRARAIIVFEDAPDFDPEEEDEPKIIQCEQIYGSGEVRSTERWCIVKQKTLWELSFALGVTGYDTVGADQAKAEKTLEHINSLK